MTLPKLTTSPKGKPMHFSVGGNKEISFRTSMDVLVYETDAPMKPGDILELDITSLAHGGKGVALFPVQGIPFSVFVPMTVPGERILAKVTAVRHRFAEAELLKIKKQSPHRIQPPCEYFASCGGCDLQHIDYETQLKEKQRMVEEAVAKVAQQGTVLPIIPSQQYGYRDRARFHTCRKNGKKVLGLMQRQSHTVIEIKKCLIASTEINRKLFSSRTAHLSTAPQMPVAGMMLYFPPSVFTQQNFQQNEKLVETVLSFLDIHSNESILDLYAGIGNFSLPAAKKAKAVVAVEGVSSAVHAAEKNRQCHAIKNWHIEAADVALWLAKHKEKYDKVILDPPRGGLGKVGALINERPIEKIVYISCDTKALARDLKQFTNYAIVRVQPIDMAPQTYHVETVVELMRKM